MITYTKNEIYLWNFHFLGMNVIICNCQTTQIYNFKQKGDILNSKDINNLKSNSSNPNWLPSYPTLYKKEKQRQGGLLTIMWRLKPEALSKGEIINQTKDRIN